MTFSAKNAARHEGSMARLLGRAEALIVRMKSGEIVPNDHLLDPVQLEMLERAGAHGHQAVSSELASDARRVAAEYIATITKENVQ